MIEGNSRYSGTDTKGAPDEKLRDGVRAVEQGKVKNPTWDYSILELRMELGNLSLAFLFVRKTMPTKLFRQFCRA